jgi:hypothetical protein
VPDSNHCPVEYWLVDLGLTTVTRAREQAQEDSDWDMIGTMDTWRKVIAHQFNLSAALRACRLRYCDNGEATLHAADTRISIVGQILGLGSWA